MNTHYPKNFEWWKLDVYAYDLVDALIKADCRLNTKIKTYSSLTPINNLFNDAVNVSWQRNIFKHIYKRAMNVNI